MNRKDGAILIVALWVMAILTIFAVALGQRASLEVKLAGYQRDKLKAIGLAKAAIEKAIGEKENNPNPNIDTLNGPWANNEEVFKDVKLGDGTSSGTFTISYSLDQTPLYGMEDEKSKININKVGDNSGEIPKQVLVDLLLSCGVEDENTANDIVDSIVAWRIHGDHPEDDYYDTPEFPYTRKGAESKNAEFKSIPELLLVHRIRENPEVLYGRDEDGDGEISPEEEGIANYLTVFPYPSLSPNDKGAVNINTASEKVLAALIGGTPSLGEDSVLLTEAIMNYRRGAGKIGNEDDGWFSFSTDVVNNLKGVPAKNLKNSYDINECSPFSPTEWNKLKQLIDSGKLCVSSDIYTVHAQAEVEKVKASITTTVDLGNPQKPYLYWHRN